MFLMKNRKRDKQETLVHLLLDHSLKQVKPLCQLGQTSFLFL